MSLSLKVYSGMLVELFAVHELVKFDDEVRCAVKAESMEAPVMANYWNFVAGLVNSMVDLC